MLIVILSLVQKVSKSCLTMWSKLVNIAFLLPCILLSKRSDLTALNKDRGEILGGIDAEYAEFPHQVVLLRGGVGGSSMCSGSLLSPSIIVTAGHCCDGYHLRNANHFYQFVTVGS